MAQGAPGRSIGKAATGAAFTAVLLFFPIYRYGINQGAHREFLPASRMK
jgi:hypothetical protein